LINTLCKKLAPDAQKPALLSSKSEKPQLTGKER